VLLSRFACVQIMLSESHTVAACAVTRSESANRRQTLECCSAYVLMLSVNQEVVECTHSAQRAPKSRHMVLRLSSPDLRGVSAHSSHTAGFANRLVRLRGAVKVTGCVSERRKWLQHAGLFAWYMISSRGGGSSWSGCPWTPSCSSRGMCQNMTYDAERHIRETSACRRCCTLGSLLGALSAAPVGC